MRNSIYAFTLITSLVLFSGCKKESPVGPVALSEYQICKSDEARVNCRRDMSFQLAFGNDVRSLCSGTYSTAVSLSGLFSVTEPTSEGVNWHQKIFSTDDTVAAEIHVSCSQSMHLKINRITADSQGTPIVSEEIPLTLTDDAHGNCKLQIPSGNYAGFQISGRTNFGNTDPAHFGVTFPASEDRSVKPLVLFCNAN